MPTILKIGYTHYLVKNDSAAAAAIKALAGAVLLESKHLKVGDHHKEYFWPEERRQTEAGLETVPWDRILRCEPLEADVSSPDALRQLSAKNQKLLL